MPALTVTGDPITDAVRALGVQGDGLTPPRGFGIWEATTNLHTQGGYESDAGGVANEGNFATFARSNAHGAKFGSWALVLTATGTGAGTVSLFLKSGTRVPVVVGTTYTFSAHLWSPSLLSAFLRIRWYDSGGTEVGSTSVSPTVALAATKDGSSRLSVTAVAPAGAATMRPLLTSPAVVAGNILVVDGVQVEAQPLATPYVETDGATATRAAARLTCPVASIVDETQGAVVARILTGFTATSAPHAADSLALWWWEDDSNNLLLLDYEVGADTWRMVRAATVGGQGAALSAAQTFGLGATKTLAGVWTPTQVRIGVDGAALIAAAGGGIPALAASTFDIGRRAVGNERWIDSNVLWMAFLPSLTDAEFAAVHALPDDDPDFRSLGLSALMVWPAVTADYQVPPVNTVAPVAA
jgi:hypothetical protein